MKYLWVRIRNKNIMNDCGKFVEIIGDLNNLDTSKTKKLL